MNRQLAAAVVASFRTEGTDVIRGRFTGFDERQWMRTEDWLHTSGLALYFLDRTRQLEIVDVIPVRILNELERNLADNRVRTAGLFQEFVKINMEFQRAQLSYANLRGFTLIPCACSDPAYRYQCDLDFLVSRRDAERCRQSVERQGYQLTGISSNKWEFRSGSTEIWTTHDPKTRTLPNLKVHFASDTEPGESEPHDGRLARMQLQVWNGVEFPALSEHDKLLAQALHLFKHLQTEWTKTAWMLEYAVAIKLHRKDGSFWQEIAAAVDMSPDIRIAVGISSLIAHRTFGADLPRRFLSATVDEIPERIRLWVDRYEDELVLVEHPGSKLYLLLRDVLRENDPYWQIGAGKKRWSLAIPVKSRPAVRGKNAKLRVKLLLAGIGFIGKRLRFHVVESLRYKVEAARWKRIVSASRA